MKVPKEIQDKYSVTDADSLAFLAVFDEPKESKILVVGDHDESIANILVESGYSNLVGVDLREYSKEDPSKCTYTYLRDDFCSIPNSDLINVGESYGPYDVFISISAIEHFGLNTYEEGGYNKYYDVIAMRKAWELLRDGGRAYITIPMGKEFLEFTPHFRVYSVNDVQYRLVQEFMVTNIWGFIADVCTVNGKDKAFGDDITWEEVINYEGFPPHVSALLLLTKVTVKRLAPDGR